MNESRSVSKKTALEVVRRAGYPPEVVEEIASQLPDPVNFDRDEALLVSYGLTRGQLSEALGSSP
jgi:hypothetical protein